MQLNFYGSISVWKYLLSKRNLLVMKLIVLLLTIACLQVRATTYAQQITLQKNNVSIEKVFEQIYKQTGYQFVYTYGLLRQARKVSIHAVNAPLKEVLETCFKDQPFTYVLTDKAIIVKRKTLPGELPVEVLVPVQISGRVTDSLGNPLVGVTIKVKDGSAGAVTDAQGNYSLTAPDDAVLVVTYIGYISQEVPVSGKKQIDIVLKQAISALSQLVVVGYGTQKKETVTGAISSVGNRELVQTPVANIGNALVGRIPGLSATQSSGEPGDNAATLRIRGISTLNGSGQDPLIVIDGIQSDLSVMNSLDANDIENISVLKDASATAVYGVQGANGVVIVTTKRGRAGKPQISFSANYGITQLTTKLKMLGSYEYALYRNEAIQTDGDPSYDQFLFTDDELWKFQHDRDYTPAEVDAMNLTPAQKAALNASPALFYSSHDYYDEQFGQTAPQQQYNLNISGGGERVRYFTSVGYFSQKGLIAHPDYGGANTNSGYERYNFRSNYDIDVIKNLQISVNLGGEIATDQGILGKDGDITSQGSRHKEMVVSILDQPPYSGPGIVDDHLVTGFVNGANPVGSKGGGGYPAIGYILTRPVMITRTSNLHTSVKLTHTMDYLTKGLSVHGTISYDDRYIKGTYRYQPVPQYTAMRDPDDPAQILFFGGTVGPATVTDNYNDDKWRRFYLEGGINYDRTFGRHAVTGLVLFNEQRTYDPGLLYNVPAGLMGLVARATYNYGERYLAEVDMGYNGSENFPPAHRFGFFPAFSAGWIISNEKFFPENNWVTWLKLRGSYGEVGNDKIGGSRFLYLPSTWAYGVSNPLSGYYFGNTDGSSQDPYYQAASENKVGNPDVTWERARKTDIGLEIKFLKDRLSFTGDYFREKRDNILWPLGTVPALVGTALPPANIGKVSNHGYELQLGWSDHIGKVDYFLQGNLSYARNKIDYMDEPDYPYPWMNQTGFQIGQYKGFYNSGFYNNADEVNNRPYSTLDGNHVQAGDLRYIDIDGDGKLDTHDDVPIGYSNLPEYAFNWSLGLMYKGFSLSVLFIGTAKGSFPMTSFYLLNPFYQTNGAALQYEYDGRWTPEKAAAGIEPTFPRASLRTYSTEDGVQNSFWLHSTDFIRLKNAEISYSFTRLGALERIGVKAVKVYANGNNLYTWSHLIDGIDPEQQDAGGASDGYLYPMTRVYNFGVNIQF